MSKQNKSHVEVVQDVRAAARLMLRRRHDFENHVVIYVIVNLAILLGVWLIWRTWTPWALVLPGLWAVGLAFDAWYSFGPPNRPITEEAIDREVARLTGRREPPTEPGPARHEAYWQTLDAARTDRLDAGLDDHPRDATRTP